MAFTVSDCRVDSQGFEFLGYRFEAGRRLVRKKSLMALRDKVRARTNAIKLRGAPTDTLFTKPDAQNSRCIRFCIRG